MPRAPILASATGALLTTLVIAAVDCRADVVDARSLTAQQQCLALTMYWEARGEGPEGMIAVGWTVLNRVQSSRFPDTPCEVIHQGGEHPPCEFSWWCDGRSDRPTERRSWQSALILAAHLLLKPPRDPTHGALYFHNAGLSPAWHRAPTARIGRHVFYR